MLTSRSQIICDSTDSLRDENEHLRQIFHKSDYSDEFIDTNKYKHDKQTYFGDYSGERNDIIWRFDRWSRARGPYGY